MADGKLSIFNLAKSGVILDFNPEAGIPDDSLRLAQNAVHENAAERAGGIRKRPGLKQFNLVNAGGAILGGTPMAVAGYGGAPTTGGGGNTGSGTGGGNGTGGAGGTLTGTSGSGTGSGSSGVSGSAGTGGSAFGSPTLPAIVLGNGSNDGKMGHSWFVSTPRFAVNATVTTSPIIPGAVASTGWSTGIQGRPFANTSDRWMYFMEGDLGSESAAAACKIYRTNGVVTQYVVTIAAVDAGSFKYPAVTAMCYVEETKKLYVSVRDGLYNYTTGPAPSCRIIEIDHVTFAQNTVGTFSGYTCHALRYESTVHKLYIGLAQKYTQAAGTPMYVYVWWPGLGYNNAQATGYYMANSFVRCMAGFNDGVMWMGMLKDSVPSVYPTLFSVGLSATTYDGTDGTTNSSVTGGTMTTHEAESMSPYAGVYSIVPFKGSLFLSWFNSGTRAAIVKGVRTDGSKTAVFTDVWTDGGTAAKKVPLELFVFNDIIYAIGTTGTGGNHLALYSDDGVTWTDVTSRMTANNPSGGFPIGVFWGIDA